MKMVKELTDTNATVHLLNEQLCTISKLLTNGKKLFRVILKYK